MTILVFDATNIIASSHSTCITVSYPRIESSLIRRWRDSKKVKCRWQKKAMRWMRTTSILPFAAYIYFEKASTSFLHPRFVICIVSRQRRRLQRRVVQMVEYFLNFWFSSRLSGWLDKLSNGEQTGTNCTSFVRQYSILITSGVFTLCQDDQPWPISSRTQIPRLAQKAAVNAFWHRQPPTKFLLLTR